MSTQKIKEANLWRWFSQACKSLGPDLFLTRIENDLDSGTPDVHGCYNGKTFWVELKALAKPKNPLKVSLNLSPGQISWHFNYARSGGKSYVLVQFGSGKDSQKFLIPNQNILQFQEPVTLGALQYLGTTVTNQSPGGVISYVA